MRTLTAQEILTLSELRDRLPLSARSLALLSASHPEETETDLLRMTLGERNIRLMQLREKTFGPEIQAVASCPDCKQKLDLPLRLPDLYADAGMASGGLLSFSTEGYEIRFRCPAIGDFPPVANFTDSNPPHVQLLKRCIYDARCEAEPHPVESIPETVLSGLLSAMEAADPMADTRLDLSCPECGKQWTEDFDIASYFLTELETEAQGLLRDVHALASRYGWTEAEVLNLGASRRRAYLEMIMDGKG